MIESNVYIYHVCLEWFKVPLADVGLFIAYRSLTQPSIRDFCDKMLQMQKQSDNRKISDTWVHVDHVNPKQEERIGVIRLYIYIYIYNHAQSQSASWSHY